jgi:hypothetical protein
VALGWPASLLVFLAGHFATAGFGCGGQTQRGRGQACLVKLTRRRKLSSMHRSFASCAAGKALCFGRILGWTVSPSRISCLTSWRQCPLGCCGDAQWHQHWLDRLGFTTSRARCSFAIPALEAAFARLQTLSRRRPGAVALVRIWSVLCALSMPSNLHWLVAHPRSEGNLENQSPQQMKKNSYGSSCSIDAGQPSDDSSMVCRTRRRALYVTKRWKLQTTLPFTACLLEKCGFRS